AYGKPLSNHLRNERLRWCRELRARQRATARALGRNPKFDRPGLEASIALVDKLIEELQPTQQQPIPWKLIAALVAIAVIAGVALALVRSATVSTATRASRTPIASVIQATATVSRPAQRAAAEALDARGIELLQQHQCSEAVDIFSQAARQDPSWYQPFSDKAFCLYELGYRDDAIAQWREALRLNRDSPDANAGLGMALYQAGEIAEGIQAYDKAMQDQNTDYRNEDWMRYQRFWSEQAIADSRPLREQIAP
ncbi:MAG TPA: tetratricopeptide repeat protein, partial [Roseiflexaceae bacterium]|nr:tetratricopeptide repeat protein [Roseiflexaceae bacterium]